jgi:hypothetical protein
MVVGVMGLLLVVGVPIYWRQHRILLLVPFLYGTIFSLFGFAKPAESVADFVTRVLIINLATGFILFFALWESRK